MRTISNSALKRYLIAIRRYSTQSLQNKLNNNKYTSFCHPFIEISHGMHEEGLISTNDIPMGSILLIENGIYNFNNTKSMEQEIKKQSHNKDIRAVMDTLIYNKNSKYIYNSNDIDAPIADIQRYLINAIEGNIYPLACKINHGLPTNIAIFRSAWNHINNQTNTDKAIVVATDNISKYTELQYDYFNIILVNETDIHSLNQYNKARRIHFDIAIDKDIENDFIKINGKYNIYKQKGGNLDKDTLTKIFKEIYSNGISNAALFRSRDNNILCKTKHHMIKLFALEVALQKQKYGGLFAQIAESNVDVVIYNQIIQSVMSYYDGSEDNGWINYLCHTYNIKMDP